MPGKKRIERLPALQFIGRFLLHVLPPGFKPQCPTLAAQWLWCSRTLYSERKNDPRSFYRKHVRESFFDCLVFMLLQWKRDASSEDEICSKRAKRIALHLGVERHSNDPRFESQFI